MDDFERLAEIKARWATTTPGPWRWGDWTAIFGQPEQERGILEHSPAHGDFPAPVRLRAAPADKVLPGLEDSLELHPELETNAVAIAHAPTDIGWLVGKVERLRGLLARLEWTGESSWATAGEEYMVPACPVCTGFRPDHLADCWLGKELGRQLPPEPPRLPAQPARPER